MAMQTVKIPDGWPVAQIEVHDNGNVVIHYKKPMVLYGIAFGDRTYPATIPHHITAGARLIIDSLVQPPVERSLHGPPYTPPPIPRGKR